MPFSVVILTAGQGKRMKPDRPRVLQPLAGRSRSPSMLAAVKHTVDPNGIMNPGTLLP